MRKRSGKKLLSLLLAPALVLSLAPAVSLTARAEEVEEVVTDYYHWLWDETSHSYEKTKDWVQCLPISLSGNKLTNNRSYYVDKDFDSSTRLDVNGTVDLILVDGRTLNCNDGINVPAGATLNIFAQEGGTGKLNCYADTNDNAAIGADNEKGDCGTINIHGGIIYADADKYGTDGAGIGGGDEGSGGNITIFDGNVTAIGGKYGAGIGGGDRDGDKGGNGGNITIRGGEVTAKGGTNAAGIGGGELGSCGDIKIYGGKVTATGGGDAAGIGSGDEARSNGSITIYGGEVTATGGNNGAGIGGGDSTPGGTIEINGGKVTATGSDNGAGIGGGTRGEGGNITIKDGSVIARGGVDSAGIGGGDLGSSGTITITSGDVEAYGGKNGAGIGSGDVAETNGKITITGGTVKAIAGDEAAGIGGGNEAAPAEITISNGNITATGGTNYGAGIGGGDTAKGGTIRISGGKVEARGGRCAAGIGGGDGGSNSSGDITISGGTVTAYGGDEAAGIGGGNGGSVENEGTITISGGNIIALGGTNYGAGIGGGDQQRGGTIRITGGDVRAFGGNEAAGIGGGDEKDGGDITISGGKVVEAIGGKLAAGIGGGNEANGGSITISGNADVTAEGGEYLDQEADKVSFYRGAAGIGGGYRGEGGTITIGGDGENDSPTVDATGGKTAAGIGGGSYKKSGTIVIKSGNITATGSAGGPGIGSGAFNSEAGNVDVTIYGGSVKVASGTYEDKEKVNQCYYLPGAGIGAAGNIQDQKNHAVEGVTEKILNMYESVFNGTINIYGGHIEAYMPDLNWSTKNGTAQIGGILAGESSKINISSKAVILIRSYPNSGLIKPMYSETINFEKNEGISSRLWWIHLKNEGVWEKDRTEPTTDLAGWFKTKTPLGSPIMIAACEHRDEDCAYTYKNETSHTNKCKYCDVSSYEQEHSWGATAYATDGEGNITATHSCTKCGQEVTYVVTDGNLVKKKSGDIILDKYNLTYGEALGDLSFSGSTAVFTDKDDESKIIAGTLCWKYPTEVPKAGTYLAVWTFVPDTEEGFARYEDLEGTVEITVEKATPVIKELPKAGAITIGQALKDSALLEGEIVHSVGDYPEAVAGGTVEVYGRDVAGSFAWADPSVKPALSDSNTAKYQVVFTPVDTKNFNTATCEVTLTVKKIQIEITSPTAKTGLVYTGLAQALVNAGSCAEGGTMQYALGENGGTSPTEGWFPSVPTAAEAGTYYVWYKAVGDGSHEDTEARCITVTISQKSSGGGSGGSTEGGDSGGGSSRPDNPSAPTESYTVPVSGESTVEVKTEISDGNAVINEITQADIDRVLGGGSGSDTDYSTPITIDVSQARSEVTSVELSDTTVKRLTEAVNTNENVKGVDIVLRNCVVSLDGEALSAITVQAEGGSVKVVVEDTKASDLNQTQQRSLEQFESAAPFRAAIESNGEEIHDFKGGAVRVSCRFDPEKGRDERYYHVFFLSKTGAIERMLTSYAEGWISFVTNHFSDYAIVYDESVENGEPEDPVDPVDPEDPVELIEMHRLYNPNSGEHFYTGNVAEKDHLVEVGWNYEGVAWSAPEESEIPVYRLYNPNAGDHHYTLNAAERDFLINEGWNDEGIGWYSVEAEDIPLFRLYNPNAVEAGAHHFTADISERDCLIDLGWKDEGIGWYGAA